MKISACLSFFSTSESRTRDFSFNDQSHTNIAIKYEKANVQPTESSSLYFSSLPLNGFTYSNNKFNSSTYCR